MFRQREAVILIGIPASGKSSFYRHYFQNHTHINLDTLHTRNKEKILLEECIRHKTSFVIDNTNPTAEIRALYINKAKKGGYRVIGYYFRSSVTECLERNAAREGKARVPDVAVKDIHSKLELPDYSEGFDELYYVFLEGGHFIVKDWENRL